MSQLPRYYKDETDFSKIQKNLYRYQCPHCLHFGYLILHGYLTGYIDSALVNKQRTGHRVFCSNRYRKRGCGRTICVTPATHMHGSSYSTNLIWMFLCLIHKGFNISQSHRRLNACCTISWAFNILRRIKQNLPRIRSGLLYYRGPPNHDGDSEIIHTIAHLIHCFPNASNPVTAFHLNTQTSLL